MAKGPGGFSVGRVLIQVAPDTSDFREDLKKKLAKEIKGLKVEIPVGVDSAKAVTQLKALDTILRRIDGRQVNIAAKVNSNQDLEKLSASLKKVSTSATDASEGFSSMSRTGFIVVGVILLLAPAIAAVATLIAGLPSLMFAFGGAIAVVALGFDGIKKAAKGFTPTIERLKKSLSANFEKQLTQPFKELNKLAPVLDSGLNKIATGIGKIIADLIKLATTPAIMGQLNTILAESGKFFENLSPAISKGIEAVIKLGEVGAQNFGLLNQTFNLFADNFLGIVNNLASNGSLTAAFEGLNKVLSSLLGLFNSLFISGIEAMAILGGPLASFIDNFAILIQNLMPFLSELTILVADVLGAAFAELGPVLRELLPGFKALAKFAGQVLVGALKVIAPLLTAVATIISQVLLKAITALEPLLPSIIAFFTELSMLIGEFLLTAFQALAPYIDQFLKFIVDMFNALTPLMPVLLELASVALKGLADILKELGPAMADMAVQVLPELVKMVSELVPAFIDFLNTVKPLIPVIAELAGVIIRELVPIFRSMFQTVKEIWPSIKQIIEGSLLQIQGIMNIILGLLSGDWERIWQGIRQILDGIFMQLKGIVKAGLIAVVEFFAALPARIMTAILGLPADMFKSGRAIVQALIDGVTSMIGTAVSKIGAAVGEVRKLFPFSPAKIGPFSGSGYTDVSGKHLMQDWAKGIEAGAPTALKAVEDVMSKTQGTMDLQADIQSDGYGNLGDRVAQALEGWTVEFDPNGVAKMVNKVNNLNKRR